jgi:Kef-type K+ transport system membrane component KefB
MSFLFFFFMQLQFRPLLVLMTRWTRTHHEASTIPQPIVFGVLFLVFLSAFITEIMGLTFLVRYTADRVFFFFFFAAFGSHDGQIGAFQIGLIVPRSRLLAELAMRIEDLVVVVFLPLFFTVSGLRTNLGELDTIGLVSGYRCNFSRSSYLCLTPSVGTGRRADTDHNDR